MKLRGVEEREREGGGGGVDGRFGLYSNRYRKSNKNRQQTETDRQVAGWPEKDKLTDRQRWIE